MKNFPKKWEIWLAKTDKIKEFSKDFRPVLIISNDLQNEFADKVIVAPLTTDDLECIEPFEVLVEKTNENKLEQDSKILFDSLFSLNKKLRLQYCLGFINNKQKELVKKVLITIFELG